MNEIDMNSAINALREAGTCTEGIEWLEQQPSVRDAWYSCDDGDIMLSALSLLRIVTSEEMDEMGHEPPDPDGWVTAVSVRKHISWEQVQDRFNSKHG